SYPAGMRTAGAHRSERTGWRRLLARLAQPVEQRTIPFAGGLPAGLALGSGRAAGRRRHHGRSRNAPRRKLVEELLGVELLRHIDALEPQPLEEGLGVERLLVADAV